MSRPAVDPVLADTQRRLALFYESSTRDPANYRVRWRAVAAIIEAWTTPATARPRRREALPENVLDFAERAARRRGEG